MWCIYISTPYCMCGIEIDYGCGAGWLLSMFVDDIFASVHRKGWKKARGWWIFPVVNGVKNRATHDHILWYVLTYFWYMMEISWDINGVKIVPYYWWIFPWYFLTGLRYQVTYVTWKLEPCELLSGLTPCPKIYPENQFLGYRHFGKPLNIDCDSIIPISIIISTLIVPPFIKDWWLNTQCHLIISAYHQSMMELMFLKFPWPAGEFPIQSLIFT